MKFNPVTQVSIKVASGYLGRSVRWVRYRIKAGDLVAYRHAPNSVTVSMESLCLYQQRTQGGGVAPLPRGLSRNPSTPP